MATIKEEESVAAGNKDLALLRDEYNRRVDDSIGALVENFRSMINAAQVSDPLQNAREEFQINVHAANIVSAAQQSLTVIRELKERRLLNDCGARMDEVDEQANAYNAAVSAAQSATKNTQARVATMLQELEDHYYSSEYKSPPGGSEASAAADGGAA